MSPEARWRILLGAAAVIAAVALPYGIVIVGKMLSPPETKARAVSIQEIPRDERIGMACEELVELEYGAGSLDDLHDPNRMDYLTGRAAPVRPELDHVRQLVCE